MASVSFWDKMQTKLKNDPGNIAQFKRWLSVLEVPLYSYDDSVAFYSEENTKLLTDKPDKKRWLRALQEPFVGHSYETWMVANREFMGYPASAWTLKSVNPLLVFESETGRSITDYDQIVEFGAGLGETIRIVRDIGSDADLYICDLPEVAKISSYYLNEELGIDCTIRYDTKSIPNRKKTLFIATWSLSEIELGMRKKVVNRFRGNDFIITAQNTFFPSSEYVRSEGNKRYMKVLLSDKGYNNLEYFRDEFPKQSETKSKIIPMEAFLDQTNPIHESFYVIGVSDDRG